MKRKNDSRLAFFNVQVFVGLLILSAGAVMAVFAQVKAIRQGSKGGSGDRQRLEVVKSPGGRLVGHAPFSFAFRPTGSDVAV